jgi:hypothetical protein
VSVKTGFKVAQDRVHWWALVTKILNLQVPLDE